MKFESSWGIQIQLFLLFEQQHLWLCQWDLSWLVCLVIREQQVECWLSCLSKNHSRHSFSYISSSYCCGSNAHIRSPLCNGSFFKLEMICVTDDIDVVFGETWLTLTDHQVNVRGPFQFTKLHARSIYRNMACLVFISWQKSVFSWLVESFEPLLKMIYLNFKSLSFITIWNVLIIITY